MSGPTTDPTSEPTSGPSEAVLSRAAREAARERVREAADIVAVIGEHVQLKRVGRRFVGLCPFHDERTPSFSVNPEEGLFYCFGCGAKGDVFSYVMRHERVDFPEALKMLASRFHIDLPERRLDEAERARLREREALCAVYEAACAAYEQALWGDADKAADLPGAAAARDYLRQRGIPEEAARRYRLGFAPAPEQAGWDWLCRALGVPPNEPNEPETRNATNRDSGRTPRFDRDILLKAGLAGLNSRDQLYDRFRGRVLFPLTDMRGRITAFGGRILGEGKPKYLNSPESPIFSKSRQLFGLHPHKEAIRRAKRALVVEGNFDLLSLAVHGVENVVAPLGTALTREHVQALAHYCEEVILLFDADAAGFKAAMRSIPFFLEKSLTARVALLPEGHDPDSFVRQQGGAAVEALVEQARPLAEFALDSLVAEHGLSLGGKAHIVRELKPLIQAAAGREQRELMIGHFAGRLGVSPNYFSGPARGPDFDAPPPPPAPSDEAEAPETRESPLRRLSRRERQLLDFLLFWPAYCEPLRREGLAEVLREPCLRELFEQMLAAGAAEAEAPEYILSAPLAPPERAYVLDRLLRPPLDMGEDPAEAAREMYAGIVAWLRRERRLRRSARLQRELEEAEQRGDRGRALDLLRAKQEGAGG